MVEPPFVGPAIEVSPNLYKTDSVGAVSRTEVPIGGGLQFQSNSSFSHFGDSMYQQYEFADFDYLANHTSSNEVSAHLLETYNDHGRPVRFGAYVLEDQIDVRLRVAWDEILQAQDASSSDSTGEDFSFKWNITVADLADLVYNYTSLSPNTTFDPVSAACA